MTPSVDHAINGQRRKALWPLRNYDASATLIKFVVEPIAVESLVGQQVLEINAINERRHANGVIAIAMQENEAHQVTHCVGKCEDRGRAATLLRADGLFLGPTFAPCP